MIPIVWILNLLARDRLSSTAQSRDIPLMCVCVVKNAVQKLHSADNFHSPAKHKQW